MLSWSVRTVEKASGPDRRRQLSSTQSASSRQDGERTQDGERKHCLSRIGCLVLTFEEQFKLFEKENHKAGE